MSRVGVPAGLPPHAQPLDEADPRQLGSHRLLARLGAGGMGSVYLASDGGAGWVAVKMLHPHLARDEHRRARFAREVELARRVRSPYTPAVLDADVAARLPYLVTVFIDGPTLADEVADRGPMATEELTQLAVNVLAALLAFHRAGVVHRDLKPANIILSRTGPRVIDLGVSRRMDDPASGSLTATGPQPGTPVLMAPEQWSGEQVTRATDVFAWAGVVVYAATGRYPFEGRTLRELRETVLRGAPALDDVDATLRRLVAPALAKRPADRPTVPELLVQLLNLPGRARADQIPDVQAGDDDAAGDQPRYIPPTTIPVIATGPVPTRSAQTREVPQPPDATPPPPQPRPSPRSDVGQQPAGGTRSGVSVAWSGVPAVPDRFVVRSTLTTAVESALCRPARDGRMPVAALVGMAGAGKSTLARAVAVNPAVRARFPDGAVWIDVGPEADLVACLAQLAEAVGWAEPISDIRRAGRALRRLLHDSALLIVADNVWDADAVAALEVGGPGCGLLVTSRSVEVVDDDAVTISVGALADEDARRLLARYARCANGVLPVQAEPVLSACGGLALALAVAGGMVAQGRRWSSVAARLARADLDRLAHRFAGYPHPDLLRALDASVGTLSAASRDRFRDLAVFEGHGRVPIVVVARWWRSTAGMDDLDTEDLIILLGGRSLVQFDPHARTLTVHDLLFAYIRADVGADGVRALHGRFATILMDTWGGLPAGLPGLRQGEAAVEPVTQYGLTHLVPHLAAAGRGDLVHQVLAAEHRQVNERSENVWYTAHDRAGLVLAYLADVRLAWRLAEQTTDDVLASGVPAATIGLELRYLLIVSSVVSVANRASPRLLAAAVAEGVISPSRALAPLRAIPNSRVRSQVLADAVQHLPADLLRDVLPIARTISDPQYRALALADLAAYLPDDDRHAVLAEALAGITAIKNSAIRGGTIAGLAPRLPADLATEALALAHALDEPQARWQALTALLPRLPADTWRSAFEQARTAARTIADPDDRAHALAHMLSRIPDDLPGDHVGTLLPEALTAARAIRDHRYQAMAAVSLAPYLPADQRRAAILDALAMAVESPRRGFGQSIAYSLAEMAPRLPATERRSLLREALDRILTIGSWGERSSALAVLAPALPADLLHDAHAAAMTMPSWYRNRALAGIIACLPADRLAAALTAAVTPGRESIDPHHLAEILHEVGARLADEQLTTILAAADSISDRAGRAAVLAALAPRLPADRRGPVLADALTAAATINDSSDQRDTIVALARHLPAELAAALLPAAHAISGPSDRASALAAVAPHLPAGDRDPILTEALDAIRADTDAPYSQEQALTALAPSLPPSLRAQALTIAHAVADSTDRLLALVALTKHAGTNSRQEILDQALITASMIDRPSERVSALVTVARQLSVHEARPAFTAALSAAETIDDPDLRAIALMDLARYLPTDFLDDVLTITRKHCLPAASGGRRFEILAAIAPRLSPEKAGTVFAETLTEIREGGNFPFLQATCLAGLAPLLPSRLLGEAVAAARSLHSPESAAWALASLAPHLPESEHHGTLAEAIELVEEALDIHIEVCRGAVAVAFCADRLLATHWPGRWRHAANLSADGGRQAALHLLKTVPAQLHKSGGSEAVQHLATALHDTFRWWP
ncbi:serine/threonine protein kinase [Frankia sp. QA3]|nr:serine/threonine protein kinase [Frankia sp. QA3]